MATETKQPDKPDFEKNWKHKLIDFLIAPSSVDEIIDICQKPLEKEIEKYKASEIESFKSHTLLHDKIMVLQKENERLTEEIKRNALAKLKSLELVEHSEKLTELYEIKSLELTVKDNELVQLKSDLELASKCWNLDIKSIHSKDTELAELREALKEANEVIRKEVVYESSGAGLLMWGRNGGDKVPNSLYSILTKLKSLLKQEPLDFIVKVDMICPVNKKHCDDECCTVGSTCNVSGNNEQLNPL